MSRVVGSPRDVHALVGEPLGVSSWVEIDQAMIDAFADVTGDHQWIHTDPVRAAEGPFGTTIAHGYLTLSLLLVLLEEILVVENRRSSVNYGLDKVRFPAPVPSGSRVRMSAILAEASDVEGGVQVKIDCVLAAEGQERPVCVATAVLRHMFADV